MAVPRTHTGSSSGSGPDAGTPTGTDANGRPRTVVVQRALRVLAVLTVLELLFQFVTAGDLFPRGGPEELHAGGAIVLHVLSGLTAIAALVLWRCRAAPIAVAVLAAAVFVLTFVQAYYGGRSTLWIHVPLAMVLVVGSVWIAAVSFRPAPPRLADGSLR